MGDGAILTAVGLVERFEVGVGVGDRDFDMQAANAISKEINQTTMSNADSTHRKSAAEGQGGRVVVAGSQGA